MGTGQRAWLVKVEEGEMEKLPVKGARNSACIFVYSFKFLRYDLEVHSIDLKVLGHHCLKDNAVTPLDDRAVRHRGSVNEVLRKAKRMLLG
jgi:hypothetical protein